MSDSNLLEIGPFIVNLSSKLPSVTKSINFLYSDFSQPTDNSFVDYYIELNTPNFIRNIIRPQAEFKLDGFIPFKPLSITEAYPLFEWGLNWCIASQAHQYLMLHAATLEKEGQVIILPAHPGSGKSTLCALLNHSGWRLFSDEFALFDLKTGRVHPLVRPISLKNESINLLKNFSSKIEVGSLVKNTSKGTVAHIKPLRDCVRKSSISAKPAWIVFPKYQVGSETLVSKLHKADVFMKVVENSFNYNELGEAGFWGARQLIEQCEGYSLTYSDIDEALLFFSSLVKKS